MTDSEIVDLATGLRSLDGSQPMDTVPRLAESFGWKVLTVHPDRAMLDAGFGMASGKIHGRDGRIVDIGPVPRPDTGGWPTWSSPGCATGSVPAPPRPWPMSRGMNVGKIKSWICRCSACGRSPDPRTGAVPG
ncbi:hypothetical protein [Nocardia exalbida]|uniref:hypothetical protein n=1 Tax=Nocardia exalbida TaxID=290231 RepID=UPI0012F6B4C9|nr:hypothetical protein [Nocardia exalbida]